MIWIVSIAVLLIIFVISTAITVILDVIGLFTFSWLAVLALMFAISAIWFIIEVLRR